MHPTTEWLPLNLTFKQIRMAKLRQYLGQSDFEEYFRRCNRSDVEFVRENLIASDFEKTGVYHIDHFWRSMAAVLGIKYFLSLGFVMLLSNLKFKKSNFKRGKLFCVTKN